MEQTTINKFIPDKPKSAYIHIQEICNTNPEFIFCNLPDFKKIHVSLTSRASISASGTTSEVLPSPSSEYVG